VTGGQGRVGVAVVGAGVISNQYLANLTRYPDLDVRIVADAFRDRAAEQAAAFGVPRSGSLADALADDDAEIVVNLTNPLSHFRVSMMALGAGKHVWTEKPFAVELDEGAKLQRAAASEAGTRIGCAPDTFLGPGLQTALGLIAAGEIGTPVSALTLYETPGPAADHRNLELLLTQGAGPLFDMAPYYLTALVQAFGPLASVVATARTARPRRVIRVGPRAGQEFTVTVPTNVSVLAQFESGPMSTSVLSWDSPLKRQGWVEITGTRATIAAGDPNRFDGEVRLKRHGAGDWVSVPLRGQSSGRGIGTLDIARAIRVGRPHRASPELAYHVLDSMVSITKSLRRKGFVRVESSCDRAEPLPAGWNPCAPTL
jgi:predicted dehydrogenase